MQIQVFLAAKPGLNSAPGTLHPVGESGHMNKCFLNHLHLVFDYRDYTDTFSGLVLHRLILIGPAYRFPRYTTTVIPRKREIISFPSYHSRNLRRDAFLKN